MLINFEENTHVKLINIFFLKLFVLIILNENDHLIMPARITSW